MRSAIWLVFLVAFTGCPTESGGGAEAQIQAREDNWCIGEDKKVSVGGYCTCRTASTRYDDSSDSCVSCTATCEGRVCGDDSCQGSCGSCADGQVCADGACVACTPTCDDKQCGEDDGCGGRCGDCEPPETEPGIVTACNCNPAPAGAYPGAVRYEATCASGFVQFQTCPETCALGGQQWREQCIDGLPCGAVVIGCNCGFIQAYPGMAVPSSSCSTGFAVIQQCPAWCGAGSAWAATCGC